MLVAQAWWDAAYNATTAQRQSPAPRPWAGRAGRPLRGRHYGHAGRPRPTAQAARRRCCRAPRPWKSASISAHCAPNHPGYCGAQDTFYVGNLKGVGRVYQQTFIDPYAVARPLPLQALDARPAEATTPRALVVAVRLCSRPYGSRQSSGEAGAHVSGVITLDHSSTKIEPK
jgi:hypothetical protein